MVIRDSGQALARSLFPPSLRGGERRGFGGSAPIKPVRGKVAGRSRLGSRVVFQVWFFGAFPLLFFRRSFVSPAGNLLSVSGALKPAYTLTYSSR